MTATNSIQSIMETTLETIKNSIDSNTIVGNPIKAESSVIVPISKETGILECNELWGPKQLPVAGEPFMAD